MAWLLVGKSLRLAAIVSASLAWKDPTNRVQYTSLLNCVSDGGKKTCWNSKNGLAESGSYLDVFRTIVMCSCSDGTWRFLNMALPQGELSFYQSWTTGIQNGVDTKGAHDRTSSWIHFFHLCLLESHCHEQEGGCIRLILGLFVYANCPVAQSNGMKWQSNGLGTKTRTPWHWSKHVKLGPSWLLLTGCHCTADKLQCWSSSSSSAAAASARSAFSTFHTTFIEQ